ncbi:MAG: LytTR family transcriptional regulator [Bacteroidales bacterium]|nr:LytTR family transcriptional regulator [Bacteroidales bacterium]
MQSPNISRPLPETFKKFVAQALYFGIVPFFFLIFAALYKPFNTDTVLDAPRASYSFNIAMIMCIILLVLLSSRMILYFTRVIRHLSMNWYRVWCAGEIVVCAFFVALYVALIGKFDLQYLEILVYTAAYLFLVLMFPYIILDLALNLAAAKNANVASVSDNKLHFYDNRHVLKFVVNTDNMLFIKADENYITIHYNEGDKRKTYDMRCSMKSIEDVCQENGILRCHRSYFINPKHVKALRKDKENVIVAELDTADDTLIPISKRYYEELVRAL